MSALAPAIGCACTVWASSQDAAAAVPGQPHGSSGADRAGRREALRWARLVEVVGAQGGHGRDDQCRAGGLGEGAEQVGAHAGDVAHVVAHVVCGTRPQQCPSAGHDCMRAAPYIVCGKLARHISSCTACLDMDWLCMTSVPTAYLLSAHVLSNYQTAHSYWHITLP